MLLGARAPCIEEVAALLREGHAVLRDMALPSKGRLVSAAQQLKEAVEALVLHHTGALPLPLGSRLVATAEAKKLHC